MFARRLIFTFIAALVNRFSLKICRYWWWVNDAAGYGTPLWYSHGVPLARGPVAQLGARFHGMEEVKGSNPFRSTNNY